MKQLLTTALLLIAATGLAKIEYHSDRIKMMDIESLQQLVSKNLRDLETSDSPQTPIIKQSLELVLAQPDQRLAASRIFSQLRNMSGSDAKFAKILAEISVDAIASLKQNEKEQSILREQNTYLYILNHMLAEIQRDKAIPEFASVIKGVRDARIRVSDPLTSYRLLNSMAQIENPSKFAAQIVPKKDPWYKFW